MSDRDKFYDELEAFAAKLVEPKGKFPMMPISIERDNRGKFGSLSFRVKGDAPISGQSNITRKTYEIGART